MMIDGRGDPDGTAFAGAVQALYSVAYGLKFAVKKAGGEDARVAPLEGLWWGAEDEGFTPESRERWQWTLMIRIPDRTDAELLSETLAAAAKKKPDLPITDVRVEMFAEGSAAQVMHVGPYADEPATIAALHAFIASEGLRLRGKHHEIYLGDPRRSAPEKLRTLLRQPVQ